MMRVGDERGRGGGAADAMLAGARAASMRSVVTRDDPAAVRRIVESTGFFYPHEVAVAVELVVERLTKGAASGYEFLFADRDGQAVGFTCFGEIACTRGSFDLYWIVVEQARRGQGLGKALLAASEQAMRGMGARRVYVETAGRAQYSPTRRFYESFGYTCAARLPDFYDAGDDKLIFVKAL